MYDPLIIDPTMTLGGKQAAFAASSSGMSLKLTHVSFGKGRYDPTGAEVALKTPVGSKITLAGGTRPTQFQIRMLAAWREDLGGETKITEIGYWAGNVLAFIWSDLSGAPAFTKTDGVPAVLFSDIAFDSVPAGSIDLTIDPAESVALAAIAAHEGASNAHPQYVAHALFPDAQADMWMAVTGSANAIVLKTPTDVVTPAYKTGQAFRFKAAYANTGAVTANVNGLGIKAVTKSGGNALSPGDLRVGAIYDLIYDGTRFQLAGGVGGGQFYTEWPTTATDNQTVFNATYTPGSVMVFVGGVKLAQSAFVATNGTTVTLNTGVAAGTSVVVVALSTFAVADTYSKGEYQSFAATQAQAQDRLSTILDRWMGPQRVHEAITSRLQPAPYDLTPGAALVVGSFGMGAKTLAAIGSLNAITAGGIYQWASGAAGAPAADNGELIHLPGNTVDVATQILTSHGSNRVWVRRRTGGVWQAPVEMFHSGNVSLFAQSLFDDADPTAARATLGLGTAALANITTSSYDTTAGRVMKVGDFGLGSTDLLDNTDDLNTLFRTGFYFAGGANRPLAAGNAFGFLTVVTNAQNNCVQTFVPQSSTSYNKSFQRLALSGVWGEWTEVWTGLNLVKTTSSVDNTPGSMLKVGDFGLGATRLSLDFTLVNIDDVTLPNGLYAVGVNTNSGTKPAVYGILEVIGRSNVAGSQGRVHQTFYETDVSFAKVWTRVYLSASSSWSTWSRQWDETNLVKTVSALDSTPGSMLKVGDFGLGLNAVGLEATSIDDLSQTGFFTAKISVTPGTWPSGATICDIYAPTIINIVSDSRSKSQYLTDRDTNISYYRAMSSGTWKPWQRVATSNDLQGVLAKSVAGGANITLTAAEAAYGVLWFTGALTANISVIVPAGFGGWSVFNRTTGNFTLTVKTATGVGQVVRQGYQSQLMCGGTNIYFSQSGFDDAHFAKEIQSTSGNTLRHIQGNYASFWRNDGANLYLMLTDSGDQYGNYNARRPFSVSFATGKVKLDDGVTMPTMPLGTNSSDGATTAFMYALLASLGLAPNSANTNTLAAGTDLNTVLTYGVYSQPAAAAATLALNYPKATAGTLTVLRGSAIFVNQQYQEYNNGQLWTRSIYNGVASDWLLSASEDYVRSWARKFTGVGIGIPTATYTIPAGGLSGNWFNITKADAVVTLPAANTMPAGAAFLFRNAAGNASVSLTSTSTITSTVSGTTLTLAPYEFVELASSGNVYYVVSRGSTSQVATTDAVKTNTDANVRRFLTSVVGITANVTLTPAQAGTAFNINQPNVTVTLPGATATGAGQSFLFRNAQNNPTTITGTGGSIFQDSNTPAATLVLAPWEWVEIQCSTSNYFVNSRGNLAQTATVDSPEFTGEVKLLGYNHLRHIQGNYGCFWRNDGSAFHLMLTNSGDQYGTYNARRPFSVNMATGKVGLAEGVTMPTMPLGTNTGDGASTAFVHAALAALVDSSPGTLDTLNELAAALGDDPNFATTMTNLLAAKAPLASPALNGTPTGPTPATGTNSTQLATTAFVKNQNYQASLGFTPVQQGGGIGQLTNKTYLGWSGSGLKVTVDTTDLGVISFENNRVGEVTHFAMSTPPPGYLKRNGAAVSRTTYSALFAKIGTLYGAGDGSTTFNVPDSRADFDRGWDDGRNVDTGRVFGSAQASQNLAHSHAGTALTAGSHSHTTTVKLDRGPGDSGNAIFGDENFYGETALNTNAAGSHSHTIAISASGGTEARPVNTAFLACIKY